MADLGLPFGIPGSGDKVPDLAKGLLRFDTRFEAILKSSP
jgi:hypothetical protein